MTERSCRELLQAHNHLRSMVAELVSLLTPGPGGLDGMKKVETRMDWYAKMIPVREKIRVVLDAEFLIDEETSIAATENPPVPVEQNAAEEADRSPQQELEEQAQRLAKTLTEKTRELEGLYRRLSAADRIIASIHSGELGGYRLIVIPSRKEILLIHPENKQLLGPFGSPWTADRYVQSLKNS